MNINFAYKYFIVALVVVFISYISVVYHFSFNYLPIANAWVWIHKR